MPAIFGEANFDFPDSLEDLKPDEDGVKPSLPQMAFWYMVLLVIMLLTWLLVFFCLRICSMRQKTRNPQERRQYVGSRTRQSFSQPDPIVYLSPSNMPPPPKYEAMAPPSYDEVVGVHYPSYQTVQPQPITQPITTAMAQASSTSCSPTTSPPTTNNTAVDEPATVTVTSETRRTSTAAVAASA